MRATRAALLAAMALSGAGLAVGSAQAAVPTQDSVRAGGNAPLPGMGGAFNLDFAVQSDPSGGNITGHAFFNIGSPTGPPIEGPIICFHVAGDTAYVSIDTAAFGPVVAKLVDGGGPGSGLDRFDAITSNSTPLNCGFQSFFGEQPVVGGDVVVVDAPPLPASKDQCKHGGYAAFGFTNQGQCVAFVQRGPKP